MVFMELISVGAYEFENRSVGPLKGPNPTLLMEISDLCDQEKEDLKYPFNIICTTLSLKPHGTKRPK